MKHPIDNIEWVDPTTLRANGYNPNVVLTQELNLLKHSLLAQGWLQPVLASTEGEIIDGYHRWWLSHNDKDVMKMSEGKVPVAFLDLTEAERMTLTIRINRAKGNHVAYKMHEIVYKLNKELGMDLDTIAKEIGANKKEVELLMQEGVFSVKDTQNHKYSKAWKPEQVKKG